MPRHRPYVMKVELARGCTQRCPFCSLPNMPWAEGPWVFMPEARWQAMIDELAAWLPQGLRIEMEGRGEPSFHKQIREFVAYARHTYPRCQLLLTTNGDRIARAPDPVAWLEALFTAGLNIALLDCYTAERYAAFCAFFPAAVKFFEDGRHPYTYHGPKFRQIILGDFSPGRENVIRKYHNQGGTVNVAAAAAAGFTIMTAPEPLQRKCVRPFRELVLWSDGSLPICCNDWAPAHVMGRFPEDTTLRDYWDALDLVRAPLLTGNRGALKPCDVCTERAGFRVGLERDWFA